MTNLLQLAEIISHAVFILLFLFSGYHVAITFISMARTFFLQVTSKKNQKSIKKSIKTKIKKWSPYSGTVVALGLLILVSALVYKNWLSFSIFISGDYHFLSAQSLGYFSRISAWNASLSVGEPNWFLWNSYRSSLYGIFGNLGLPSNVVMNVFVLWFIIFCAPIISFFFIRTFTKKVFPAFIFSFLLLFNTYLFTSIVAGHLLLNVAFFLGILSFTFYVRFIHTKLSNNFLLVLSAVILWITGVVDFRVLYLLVPCFFLYQILYLLLNKIKIPVRIFLRKNIYYSLLLVLLNSSWLLPTVFIQERNLFLSRLIFAKGLIDLFNSWSNTYYYWSLSEKIIWGVHTPIPIIFMLFPLLVMLVTYFAYKNKTVLIFLIFFLIGSFFGKQNTAPLARVYEFMFVHIPGFSAFRDATKFFQITTFALPVIFAVGYEHIKIRQVKQLVLISVMFLTFLNVISFVRLQNHLLVPAVVPDYYQDIFKIQSKEFGRVLWVPRHESIIHTTLHNPRVSLNEIKEKNWLKFFEKLEDEERPQSTNEVLDSEYFDEILALTSVEYLFVPEQLQTENDSIDDDAFYYGDNREEIVAILDTKDWLKKVPIASDKASIYKTTVSRPHIYLTDTQETIQNAFELEATRVDYEYVNPSIYILDLKNIQNDTYLTFTETHSSQWLLGPEFTSHLNFIQWKDYSFSEENKFANQLHFGVFKINKELLQEITDTYQVNPDGSINARVTLYFSPQKQVIIGNILVLVFSTVIISYLLIYIYMKVRK